MVDTAKVLAQASPAAGTLTTLYTAPAAAVISSLVICNQGSTGATFRISVAIAAAADAPAQYLYFDTPITGNDTIVATIGVTLAATDLIRVYSSSGLLSFSVFGVEVT